jgi:hypothetical protein
MTLEMIAAKKCAEGGNEGILDIPKVMVGSKVDGSALDHYSQLFSSALIVSMAAFLTL